VKKAIRQQLQEILPEAAEDMRVFNQAMMELGAVVCVPNGAPKCEVCPLAELCAGRAMGTAEQLPVKQAKKARRMEEKTVFLLFRQGQVALRKRPETGLLAGLWEFPHVEGALAEAAASEAVKAWDITPKEWKSRLTAKHIFTHVEWHLTGYALEVSGAGDEDWVWMDQAALAQHAVPSAFARFYEEAIRVLKEEKPWDC